VYKIFCCLTCTAEYHFFDMKWLTVSLAVNVHRDGRLKLATGSQSESGDDKSSGGHEERYSDDDEYEEVALCSTCTYLSAPFFITLYYN